MALLPGRPGRADAPLPLSLAHRRHEDGAADAARLARHARVLPLRGHPLGRPHVFVVRPPTRYGTGGTPLPPRPPHAGRQFRAPEEARLLASGRARILPRGHRRRRRPRRLVHQARDPRSPGEASAPRPCLRRAGGADRPRPLGRLLPAVAPDAGPAGLCRHELRQPGNPCAARSRVAQVRVPEDRDPGAGGPGGGGPEGPGGAAVPRPCPSGRLGMERRGLDELECNLPVPGSLPNGRRHRVRPQPAGI